MESGSTAPKYCRNEDLQVRQLRLCWVQASAQSATQRRQLGDVTVNTRPLNNKEELFYLPQRLIIATVHLKHLGSVKICFWGLKLQCTVNSCITPEVVWCREKVKSHWKASSMQHTQTACILLSSKHWQKDLDKKQMKMSPGRRKIQQPQRIVLETIRLSSSITEDPSI